MTKALVGALAAAVLLAGAPLQAKGITKDEFDALTSKLEANAEKWLDNKPIDEAAEAPLKDLAFDKDSAEFLATYLRASRRGAASLYVDARLMARLRTAGPEVLDAVLPAVEQLVARARGAYRPMPRYSARYLDALKMPEYRRGLNITTAEIMARMGVLETRREEKVEREIPLARHNEVAGDVEKLAYELMVKDPTGRRDDLLVRTLATGEARGSATFLTILDLIDKQTRKMPADRARNLHNRLRPHAQRLQMQGRKDYFDRGTVRLSRDAASEFAKESKYAGIEIIDTMNKLAKVAKLPELPKPDPKKIDELHKKRGRR